MSATLTITFPTMRQADLLRRYAEETYDGFESTIVHTEKPVPEGVIERGEERSRKRLEELEKRRESADTSWVKMAPAGARLK